MKTDVLTFAALVFVVGLLMSTVSVSEIFRSGEKEATAASASSQNGSASR